MKSTDIKTSENLIFTLRSIYDKYGYSRYKMNKFEEYDLYAKNKDFLVSEGVITFTDTNGKLMALKPDVTLSIVKNTKDIKNTVQKLYYNENVYRVSKGTHSFKEIMQVGLEAIGDIDDYCVCEVLSLAAKSLDCTGKDCVLEVSHLKILSDVIDYVGVPNGEKDKVLNLIGEKNKHELKKLCKNFEIDDDKAELLCKLISLYGNPNTVLPVIKDMLKNIVDIETLSSFEKVILALNLDMLRIDFSIVDDMRYYNGFVFKGFANGLPSSVLSGGQYDTLMKRMNRKCGAIGFAVYLDMFEEFSKNEYDVDTLLIYDDKSNIKDVKNYAEKLINNNESVIVQKQIPNGIKYKRLIKMIDGEVKNNA